MPSARSPPWRASRRCCPRQVTRPAPRRPIIRGSATGAAGSGSTRSAASPRRPTSPTLPARLSFLYVVEQGGTVRVVDDGNVLGQPLPRHLRPGLVRGRARPALDRLRPRLRAQPPLLRLLHEPRREHRDRRVPRCVQHPGAGELAPQGDRDPAPWAGEPQRRPAPVRPRRASCTRPPATAAAPATRTRTPRTSTSCSASSCGSTPASTAQALHGRRAATRSSARPAGTRSTPSACATRSGSRSTGRRIADRRRRAGPLGGGRLRRPPRPARRQLRLGPLRGRPSLQLPRRQRGAASEAPLPAADLRVQAPHRTAPRRGAARSSAATSSATPSSTASVGATCTPMPTRVSCGASSPAATAAGATGRWASTSTTRAPSARERTGESTWLPWMARCTGSCTSSRRRSPATSPRGTPTRCRQ